ncbi:MAG: 50S ribosomal protein L1 [Methanothermobacter sp.]|nr:50S ribosomal protein L1 [Methanothermobacter sp.]
MKQEILEAVKKAKEQSKPRNFTQSIDIVINIKDLDVNKPENRFEEEVSLPHGRGKEVKIAVIADGELALQAKKAGADLIITRDDLEELGKNRKKAKRLANEYEFFIAQADLMPLVGRFLGPVLGPRKKMPKPIPATANPAPLIKKLRDTVRVRVKDQPLIHTTVGTEKMDDEKITENIESILDVLDRNLEKGRKQVKSMYIKTTMGPAVKVI